MGECGFLMLGRFGCLLLLLVLLRLEAGPGGWRLGRVEWTRGGWRQRHAGSIHPTRPKMGHGTSSPGPVLMPGERASGCHAMVTSCPTAGHPGQSVGTLQPNGTSECSSEYLYLRHLRTYGTTECAESFFGRGEQTIPERAPAESPIRTSIVTSSYQAGPSRCLSGRNTDRPESAALGCFRTELPGGYVRASLQLPLLWCPLVSLGVPPSQEHDGGTSGVYWQTGFTLRGSELEHCDFGHGLVASWAWVQFFCPSPPSHPSSPTDPFRPWAGKQDGGCVDGHGHGHGHDGHGRKHGQETKCETLRKGPWETGRSESTIDLHTPRPRHDAGPLSIHASHRLCMAQLRRTALHCQDCQTASMGWEASLTRPDGNSHAEPTHSVVSQHRPRANLPISVGWRHHGEGQSSTSSFHWIAPAREALFLFLALPSHPRGAPPSKASSSSSTP